MPVDHCICFNVSFSELKSFAAKHHSDLDGLRREFGCGRGCAMCVPYIRAMLATGKTSFEPIQGLPDDSPAARPSEL